MCWCRPEIRTPNCGRIGCHPPDKSKELEKAITDRGETMKYKYLVSVTFKTPENSQGHSHIFVESASVFSPENWDEMKNQFLETHSLSSETVVAITGLALISTSNDEEKPVIGTRTGL